MIKLMEVSMVKWMKERIKSLAVLQTKTKRARKTTLPKEEYEALKKEIEAERGTKLPVWWDHNSAACDAVVRTIEITAYLNMYHELRGSEYRHDIAKGWDYHYEKCIKQIKEELAKDHDSK